jgi:hypothetical protein
MTLASGIVDIARSMRAAGPRSSEQLYMIAFIGRLALSDAVMADDAGIASKETLRLIFVF